MPETTVTGLKELEKALAKLDIKTAGTSLRTALKDEAQPMKNQIVANMPVRSGDLKSSVRLSSNVGKSKRSKYSARARILVGGKGTKTRKQVSHALQVEFGTSKTRKNEEQAPIRKGFDSNINSFISGFKQRLKQKILEGSK